MPDNRIERLQSLQALLDRAGWSQAALARAVGVSPQFIAEILSGRRQPSPRIVLDVPLALSRQLHRDATQIRLEVFGVLDVVARPSLLDQALNGARRE
ncbi:MAG TPA: helix-turn-helix transcriptional regulator [Actinomycetota bacterium]|nr:helix-turn-helix transcriptional regulator [Actinomycetota bacterium]